MDIAINLVLLAFGSVSCLIGAHLQRDSAPSEPVQTSTRLNVRWVGIVDVRTGDGWVVPACESPNTVKTVGLDIRVEWRGAEVIFTGETSPNGSAVQFRMRAGEQRPLLHDLLVTVSRDYEQANAWLETQRGLTPAGMAAVA